MPWLRARLGLRRRGLGGPARRPRSTEALTERIRASGTDIVSSYRVGPVDYFLARMSPLRYKLYVVEPDPPPEAEAELLAAGVREPESAEERYFLEKASSGYGPIYPLIIDPNIEEVSVVEPGRPVMALHRGAEGVWVETNIVLDRGEADSLALSLARKAGRQLSLASPVAEGVTSEGHRVSVTFGREVSRAGSTVVVRKFPERPYTIVDLIAMKALTPLEAAYLWMLVEAQAFILIVGNMGSGKTTLLQALASLIPPGRRVITIEDTPELRLPLESWDGLYTRPAPPGDPELEVGLEDLIRFALRRRGDYIIVGEVRGREARLLAQAAATGHGCMATFHADDADSAVVRLSLDPISLPSLFLRSIKAIATVRRMVGYDGRVVRRLVAVTEVDGDELRDVVAWDQASGEPAPSAPEELVESSRAIVWAWERLGRPMASPTAELEARASFLSELVGAQGEDFRESLVRFYEQRAVLA